MTIEPQKKKSMKLVFLIGLAGIVESVVALTTLQKFDLMLALGLLVGAFSLWLQIRKKA
jgi:hypothetical protein